MSTKKAVFIIFTRPEGACRFCDLYKTNQHAKLMDLLEKDRRVTPINLEARMETKGPHAVQYDNDGNFDEEAYIHPDILNDIYWKWFPTFYLFTRDSWTNPNKELEGYVFGGTIIINDKGIQDMKEPPDEYDPTAESIMEWIIKKLNTELFELKSLHKIQRIRRR